MRKLILSISCAMILTISPAVLQARTGEELFLKYCKACHGTDGKGQTAMGKRLKIKDYTKAEVQEEFTDEFMAKVILEGIKNEKGKKVMLPFEKKMTPEEIAEVVAYVRSLKE